MLVLGIETSCDDTSLALYDSDKGVLASSIFSQTDIHARFGGVIPEIASRNHIIKLRPLLGRVLSEADKKITDIDMIGVTNAPGLIGALFVGVSFAKGMGYALKIPVVPINHLTGHILAAELAHDGLEPEYMALIISGGHTHIYDVDRSLNFNLIARTIDDAAGEAFDKVAKMLGGPYPGGPFIEKTATEGDENAVKLPIAMKNKPDFSFSGLKTAVLNAKNSGKYSDTDIAASFQKTATDTLILKTLRAAKQLGRKKIVVAGGVACNGYLRRAFQAAGEKEGFEIYFPTPKLCTDNGDMIAYAAYKFSRKRQFAGLTESAKDQDPFIHAR